MRRRGTARPSFKRFQIRQQIVNLVGIELERRHGRMAGFDTLGQCFTKGFDRIAVVQCPERRRDLERAFTRAAYGMAARTVLARKAFAALFGRRGQGRCRQHQSDRSSDQSLAQHRRQHFCTTVGLLRFLTAAEGTNLDLRQCRARASISQPPAQCADFRGSAQFGST